ncbi:MAG: hypothetical protein F6K39_36505 [Okeania sp. SIO3B3]|nr:hypothetical protein [Okeania sp. SIO3B3]
MLRAEGRREYWFKARSFFITDYPNMILLCLNFKQDLRKLTFNTPYVGANAIRPYST